MAAVLALAITAACGAETDDKPRLALGEKGVLRLGDEGVQALGFPSGGDGSMLAFVGSGHLLAAEFRLALVRNGKVKQISAEGVHVHDFAWMPDGKRLLALERPQGVRDSRTRLTEYDLDGKARRHLDLPEAVRETAGMTVRPDGADAVVAVRSGQLDKEELVQINLSSGDWEPLTSTPNQEGSPVFIDDERLAYVFNKQLQVGDPYDTEVRILNIRTRESQVLTKPGTRFGDVVLAPDRRALVVDGSQDGLRALYLLPLTGGELTRLSDRGGTFAVEPDGGHAVVYSGQHQRLERMELTPSGR